MTYGPTFTINTTPSGAVPCRLIPDAATILGGIVPLGASVALFHFVSGQEGSASMAGGATQYCVLDGNGNAVIGTTTINVTDTSIAVPLAGLVTGYFRIVSQGANGVVTGDMVIDVPNPLLPAVTGSQRGYFASWLGLGPDRDNYSFQITDNGLGGDPAEILAAMQADPYTHGPQDPARPHTALVSPLPQAVSPTEDPLPTDWATLFTTLKNGGITGVRAEGPSNEPENGGWPDPPTTYYDQFATDVLAVDSTAKLYGYCSGGVFNNSSLADITTFINAATQPLHGITNHSENGNQNRSSIVGLRQMRSAQRAAIGSLDWCETETGVYGGTFGVLQPRRHARQAAIFLMVCEQFGIPKENVYFYPYQDENDYPGFLADQVFGSNGNFEVRGGGMAVHVYSEAVRGTTCNPSNRPAVLSFGAAGSMSDALFAGLHYTAGTRGDVVVLATNGLQSDTVTLSCSAAPTAAWDGWGAPRTVTNNGGGHYTVAVDDLLTYVFLPANSTVSVVDTGSGAIALGQQAALAQLANGSWAACNLSPATGGIPGNVPLPFVATTTGVQTFSYPVSQPVGGYALTTGGEQISSASGLLSVVVKAADGTVVDTWTDATQVSFAIPSASELNTSDPCTRTSFCDGAFSLVRRFASPVTTSELTFEITSTYGGQPDAAASNNTTTSNLFVQPGFWNSFSPENDPQILSLGNLVVYQAPAGPPPPPTSAPQFPAIYAYFG